MTTQRNTMRMLLMPGDGVVPEIVAAAIRVDEWATAKFPFGIALDREEVGFASLQRRIPVRQRLRS
jgi:isocitrate/isopropylmalate dehydrogenase